MTKPDPSNAETGPDPAELVWTPEQVAEHLKLSRAHVYRLAQQHRLPYIRFGKCLRFVPAEIEKFLAAKTVPAAK